jgi:hypothetical protein
MKVLVFEEAIEDLAEGFRLHERQAEGLGSYFLDSALVQLNGKNRVGIEIPVKHQAFDRKWHGIPTC